MDNPYLSIVGGAGAPAPTHDDNPYLSIIGGQTASAPSGNPYAAIASGNTASASDENQSFTDKVSDIWGSDENTLKKVWDTANTPLLDLHRSGATGIEAGVENLLSGLTSPLSAGLALITLGTSLPESAGLNLGERAVSVLGPKLGAQGINAAKVGSKLISAGFTIDQFRQLYEESPQLRTAIHNGDTDKALELGTEMLGQGAMAVLGARHGLSDAFEAAKQRQAYSELDAPRGQSTADHRWFEEANRENHDLINKLIPDPHRQEALHFYGDAVAKADINKAQGLPADTPEDVLRDQIAQVSAADQLPAGLKKQTLRGLNNALTVSPTEVEALDGVKAVYEGVRKTANEYLTNPIPERQNYIARPRWEGEADPQDTLVDDKRFRPTAQSGPIDRENRYSMERKFDTTVDGILAGNVPVKTNGEYSFGLANNLHDYQNRIGKEIAASRYNQYATQAFDEQGRPLAVPIGSVTIDPATGEKIINTSAIDLTKVIGKDGRPLSENPYFTGPVDRFADYDRSIRNTTRNSVNQVIDDEKLSSNGPDEPPDIEPGSLLETRYAYHPSIAEEARQIQAPEPSFVEKSAVGKSLLKLNKYLKESSLSLSAFHWVQEGLRGIESGIAPWKLFDLPPLDVMHDPESRKFVEAGGIQPGLEQNMSRYTEGEKGGGIYSRIPGARQLIEKSNDALFAPNGFIDRLKFAIAQKNLERLQQHPDFRVTDDMSPAEKQQREMSAYKVAGLMANARTGGLNYLQMQRSRNFQDLLRVTTLAPDFLESQIRDTAFALQYPSIGGKDLARIAVYNWMAARALNYAITQNPHMETPFGVVSPDGKQVYQVRTMPEDIAHAVGDPWGYLTGRIGPVGQTVMEAASGKNHFGKPADMADQVRDFIGRFIAAPATPVYNAATGQANGQSAAALGVNVAANVAGVSPKQNRTPAEDLAMQSLGEKRGSTEKTPGQIAHQQLLYGLIDRIHNGDKTALADAAQAVSEGKLQHSDVKELIAAQKTSKLASQVKSLPFDRALAVWNLADNDERLSLGAAMLKKAAEYNKTERATLGPVEQRKYDQAFKQFYAELQALHAAQEDR